MGSKSWTWKRQIAEMDDSSNGAEATKVTKEIKEYVEAVRAPSTLSTFSAESKERAVSTLSADVSLGAADSGVDQALETLEDQSKNNGLLGKYVEELQMTAALEVSLTTRYYVLVRT